METYKDLMDSPLTKDEEKFAQAFRKYEKIIRYDKFKDEFDLMSCLYGDGKFPAFKRDIDAWYASYSREQPATVTSCSEQNRRLGNDAFVEKKLKTACSFYNMALLQAGQNKLHLAMAHANRAAALLEIGDYQTAYDDAACARAAGYPADTVAKVIMRQARCAFKLGRLDKLREHLNEVPAEVKQTHYQKAMLEYEAALAIDDVAKVIPGGEEATHASGEEPPATIEKNASGYRVVASKGIGKNELLFTDRAVALVPADARTFCQNCAALTHTPFPCNECHGLIQYCSLACRCEHAAVHQHECRLFSSGLYKSFAHMSHLAMRVLLAELPQLVGVLHDLRSPTQLWTELTGCGKRIHMGTELGRSLLAPFDRMKIAARLKNEVTVHTLVIMRYLESIGSVGNIFRDNGLQFSDWKIVMAALCMRRMIQLLSWCQTMLSPSLRFKAYEAERGILELNMWTETPKHLSIGRLHSLQFSELKALAYFPFLNHCPNSCSADLMNLQFNGREMRSYALRPYAKGEPIQRRHIYYNCLMRICDDVDMEALARRNNQILRQRCQWCSHVFVQPIYENLTQLVPDGLVDMWGTIPAPCPACAREQPTELINKLDKEFAYPIVTRAHCERLLKLYENLDTVYLASHCVKLKYGGIIVQCLVEYLSSYPIVSDEGIDKLCKIILYNILWRKTFEPEFSLERTCSMLPLLDMMAMGYYTPKAPFIETMLRLVTTLSPDFQTIIMNYYNDYIKPLMDSEQSDQ